jgi:hypothetical protein
MRRACILLALLGAACGSESDAPCAGDNPGLWVRVSYSGPGDTCDFGTENDSNYDVAIDVGGVHLSRPDSVGAGKTGTSIFFDAWLFAWPEGVAEGDPGTITFFVTGEGTRADGQADFTAHPADCQEVRIDATCSSP